MENTVNLSEIRIMFPYENERINLNSRSKEQDINSDNLIFGSMENTVNLSEIRIMFPYENERKNLNFRGEVYADFIFGSMGKLKTLTSILDLL